MKRGITLKQFFTQAQIDAAIAAAPERVSDPDSPYDMNEPAAIRTYWSKAVLTFPGGHPHQDPLWHKKRRSLLGEAQEKADIK